VIVALDNGYIVRVARKQKSSAEPAYACTDDKNFRHLRILTRASGHRPPLQ
jgi:hypothetical protein